MRKKDVGDTWYKIRDMDNAPRTRPRPGLVRPEWALVLGGADCVWDDVLAVEAMYGRQWDGQVIAANDIGAHWPRPLDHWVSLHPNKFIQWEPLRVRHGCDLTGGYQKWGTTRHGRVTDIQVNPWAGGSSGMLAVQAAWTLGCTRVIMCGIPMTPTAHFKQSKESFPTQWRAAVGHWRSWDRINLKLQGWARSMSGKTRELLGEPTLAWLRSGGPLGAPPTDVPEGARGRWWKGEWQPG